MSSVQLSSRYVLAIRRGNIGTQEDVMVLINLISYWLVATNFCNRFSPQSTLPSALQTEGIKIGILTQNFRTAQ